MKKVTLIPGDGIGPEIAHSLVQVFQAAHVPVEFEEAIAGSKAYEKTGQLVPDDVYQSLERNRVAIKGPITTPIGYGFSSVNVALRRRYDLYANVRPIKSIEGVETRFKDVNLVIFRENTEGIYIGEESFEDSLEHSAVAVKRITRKCSERIIRAAFEYAKSHALDKVTVAHKANILKLTDGMFLATAREVAKDYLGLTLEEVVIDNMCMQLVSKPEQFQVIVTMNLYGDILSDLCAGLIGGLGLAPGANIGDDMAIFEAVHGSAPDIAGQDKANPLALLYTGINLLDFLDLTSYADQIEQAIEKTLMDKQNRTVDLGGQMGTRAFTQKVIGNLRRD